MSRFTARLLPCILTASMCAVAPAAERDSEKPSQDVAAESATHEELDPLAVKFDHLASLCLHPNGNLLACDVEAEVIKVIDPAGKHIDTIQLEFGPEAIAVAADGTIYCGGHGRLARLDAAGKLLASAKAPGDAEAPASKESLRRAKACDVESRLRVSGIAVAGKDVFVAFGSGWSTLSTSKLFRFDRQLQNPKLLAEGMKGCCQRCDITADADTLYLAENTAHRIVCYDRDGNVQNKWGQKSRTEIEGFGACCNPMNVCLDSKGVLYTAESGSGRVKRYTTGGKFLSLVGYLAVDRFERAGPHAASCSNIAIAVTPDGKRVYVMDYRNKQIRVLQEKG